MALNGLFCADVPLRTFFLKKFLTESSHVQALKLLWCCVCMLAEAESGSDMGQNHPAGRECFSWTERYEGKVLLFWRWAWAQVCAFFGLISYTSRLAYGFFFSQFFPVLVIIISFHFSFFLISGFYTVSGKIVNP